MKFILRLFLLLLPAAGFSQDIAFSRKMVDTLTSPYFWGRGYTNDGMKKTAEFLATEFKSYGLTPMDGKKFMQTFAFPVNTFPGKMEVSINGRRLLPGKDFIVGEQSRHVRANGTLVATDSTKFENKESWTTVFLEDKLTWSVSTEAVNGTIIKINKRSLGGEIPKTITAEIDNKLVSNFKASNVCGMVKGTSKPDSILLITAHYDHLGGMGKDTYFPGANDNASGIALLLNLAHYYAEHPQPYSIGFICFAAEEAGLIGSEYFTEHPLVPLKQIRFLINTDLAGTGDDGITVVNATEFPAEFKWMNQINDEHKLLTKINARGKAANSDHYFFTEKGVPAFFFYTLGGVTAYHDVNDVAATLPLNEQEDLFKLVVKFNDKLMGK